MRGFVLGGLHDGEDDDEVVLVFGEERGSFVDRACDAANGTEDFCVWADDDGGCWAYFLAPLVIVRRER